MVKDYSDSERGNPLPPHGLLFPISSKGSFICMHRQDSTYHSLCYTSRGALAGTRNSSMGPPHEGSIQQQGRVGKRIYVFIYFWTHLFSGTASGMASESVRGRFCLYIFSCLYPLKVQERCPGHTSTV